MFWRKQSKRALVVVAIFLAALPALAGQTGQKETNPSPRFVIDKTLHDFGEVFAGEEIYSTFTVTNRGNAPLELSDKPLLATRPSVSLYSRPTGDHSLALRTASTFRPAPV